MYNAFPGFKCANSVLAEFHCPSRARAREGPLGGNRKFKLAGFVFWGPDGAVWNGTSRVCRRHYAVYDRLSGTTLLDLI